MSDSNPRVRLPVVSETNRPGCSAAVCPAGCTCAPPASAPSGPALVTRRSFLKGAAATAAGVITGSGILTSLASANEREEAILAPSWMRTDYAPPPIPGVAFAMAIDITRCIGCRKCAYACAQENNVGRDSGFHWIELHRMERGSLDLELSDTRYREAGDARFWYLAVGCQQCENPPCVLACPVQATWREPDGIVLIDYRKCIGCRYCMINCPYAARHFNWKRPVVPRQERNENVPLRQLGVVEKCTFCVHRTRRGRLPACVEACPVGARIFGDLNDPKSPVSRVLARKSTIVLREDLGTRPRVFYVG